MSGTDPRDRDAIDPLQQDTTYDDQSVVRHEEQAHVSTELAEAGRVRVAKHVETLPVEQTVERNIEHADTSTREAAVEGDTGEVLTLPDGSVSIPVFEEVLVVTKKLVVRERVIVRKTTVVDEHVLRTELRREHVSVEADGDVEVEDRTQLPTTPPTSTSSTTTETRETTQPAGDATTALPVQDRTV